MPEPPKPKPTSRFASRPMPMTIAQYEGWCAECGGDIEPGQSLVLVDGAWVHNGGCR